MLSDFDMYRHDLTNYLYICLSTCLPIYLLVLQTAKSKNKKTNKQKTKTHTVFRFFPLNRVN